ncbi:subtilase family protein [Actinidia rufa]|uniref:Subtilase family protein n=1 Tax=Actinidia rufa TaxID=165716 RepID=A0A7J0G8P5_9ERIC|nr:subtilase family protein [Actinidia rufa]
MKIQLCVFWLLILHLSASSAQHRQVYVVYFGEHSGEKTTCEIADDHHSYLLYVKGSKEEAKASLIYSYKNVINGFSVTPDEATKLSGGEAKNPYEELLQKANYGKDIIVGVLDSGIWPESQSFSDEGMEPIPKSWKGKCQTGVDFNRSHCNRKIIGARYYLKSCEERFGRLNNGEDYRSPRDKDSPGTHTASTVGGGRRVANVSGPGDFASGNASGGAPLVRLAIYKACWSIKGPSKADGNTCLDDDLLAAIDDAICDGVHVLSISLGGTRSRPYTEDGIAIGTLHAVKRNIEVVCSAGNPGPSPKTVTNIAPWMITVTASSIDRDFPSAVVLGNQMKVVGLIVTPFKLKQGKIHRVIYAKDAEVPGNMPPRYPFSKPSERKDCSVMGIEREECFGGIALPLMDGFAIVNYTRNSTNPTATLVPGTTVSAHASRHIARNSDPRVYWQPDITAPGMNILAAWSEAISPTKLEDDHRVFKYSFDSGTSMSCPHVTAVAALLKAIHPS